MTLAQDPRWARPFLRTGFWPIPQKPHAATTRWSTRTLFASHGLQPKASSTPRGPRRGAITLALRKTISVVRGAANLCFQRADNLCSQEQHVSALEK